MNLPARRRHGRQFAAAALAGTTVLGLATAVGAPAAGAQTASPSMAPAVDIQMDSDNAGITAEGQTTGALGESYTITGTKWCFGDKKTGQWIAAKLLDGTNPVIDAPVNMSAGHTAIRQPDGSTAELGGRGVFAMLKASDDPTGSGNCSLDATVTLPSTENSTAVAANFTPGAKKAIVLLAGSFGPKTGGGAPHAATLGLAVAEATPPAASTRTVALAGDRVQGILGQYQAAYSAAAGKFYLSGVRAAGMVDGALADSASTLAEVDPATGRVVRAAALPAVPVPAGGIRGVDDVTGLSTQIPAYGIAADDSRGLLWVTETRGNTVAAYDRTTFELVWRSAVDAVPHGRDVSVQPNGDVLVTGSGGLTKITGTRGSFSVAPFGPHGEGQFAVAMSAVRGPGGLYVSDSATHRVRVLDAGTGALVRDIPFTGTSAAEGVTHGLLGVDASTGVVVVADQGARNATTKAYESSGIGFYSATDGRTLGRLDVGTQNYSVAVDEARDLAFVGDFATGEVRVIDLAAAAKGTPVVVGLLNATPAGSRGINQLVAFDGKILAVGKDGAYPGVTVPWGLGVKTGQQSSVTANADSLLILTVNETAGVFDPAADATTAGAQPGYSLADVPVVPKTAPPTTAPSTTVPSTTVPTTSEPSTTVPSTTVPTTVPTTTTVNPTTTVPTTTVKPGTGSLGEIGGQAGPSLPQLALYAFLGGLGFLGGVFAGLAPFQAQLAGFLHTVGLR